MTFHISINDLAVSEVDTTRPRQKCLSSLFETENYFASVE